MFVRQVNPEFLTQTEFCQHLVERIQPPVGLIKTVPVNQFPEYLEKERIAGILQSPFDIYGIGVVVTFPVFIIIKVAAMALDVVVFCNDVVL